MMLDRLDMTPEIAMPDITAVVQELGNWPAMPYSEPWKTASKTEKIYGNFTWSQHNEAHFKKLRLLHNHFCYGGLIFQRKVLVTAKYLTYLFENCKENTAQKYISNHQ